MNTPAQPLQVFYDGACPLCTRECNHYKKRDRLQKIEWIDISQPTFHAPDYNLNPLRVQKVMHARNQNGQLFTEVQAFRQIWRTLPWQPWTGFLRLLLQIPGAMWLAGLLYRLFARNRYRLTGRCTPTSCNLPPPAK